MKTFSGDDAIDPSGVSLKGYYWIGAVSIAIGVAVVFILNAVTPVEFILQRMARFRGASSAAEYGGNIIVFAVTLSCVFFVTPRASELLTEFVHMTGFPCTNTLMGLGYQAAH